MTQSDFVCHAASLRICLKTTDATLVALLLSCLGFCCEPKGKVTLIPVQLKLLTSLCLGLPLALQTAFCSATKGFSETPPRSGLHWRGAPSFWPWHCMWGCVGADQLQITPLSCAPLSPGALHSMLGAMDKRVSEEVTVPSLQCGLLKASMSHSSSGCLLVFSAHRIGRGEITQPQFSACTACIKTTIKCIESFLD